jgi:hypothetical protein
LFRASEGVGGLPRGRLNGEKSAYVRKGGEGEKGRRDRGEGRRKDNKEEKRTRDLTHLSHQRLHRPLIIRQRRLDVRESRQAAASRSSRQCRSKRGEKGREKRTHRRPEPGSKACRRRSALLSSCSVHRVLLLLRTVVGVCVSGSGGAEGGGKAAHCLLELATLRALNSPSSGQYDCKLLIPSHRSERAAAPSSDSRLVSATSKQRDAPDKRARGVRGDVQLLLHVSPSPLRPVLSLPRLSSRRRRRSNVARSSSLLRWIGVRRWRRAGYAACCNREPEQKRGEEREAEGDLLPFLSKCPSRKSVDLIVCTE